MEETEREIDIYIYILKERKTDDENIESTRMEKWIKGER
jgi:hypothetical protein